jgi:hypothetical protein
MRRRNVDGSSRCDWRSLRELAKWRRLVCATGHALVFAWLGIVVAACGGALGGERPAETGPTTPVVQDTDTTISASADRAAEALRDLALRVAPMPVYGWEETPPGVEILARWLPVIEETEPVPDTGFPEANPRVVGEGRADPEAQVVFGYEGGWLVLVENFRGDLGETPGTSLSDVAGKAAAVYSVNGGVLVQWSDDGRWYGLFGRGVASANVVSLASTVVRLGIEGTTDSSGGAQESSY